MAVRCHVCRGQKRVCRLGGVIVDCEECKAVGYIETKIITPEPEVVAEEVKEVAQGFIEEGKREEPKAVKVKPKGKAKKGKK